MKIGSQYFTGLCDNPCPAGVDYFCLNHLLCCRRAALPSRVRCQPSLLACSRRASLSFPVLEASLCCWCAVNCSTRPALSSPLSKASLCCWLNDACCRQAALSSPVSEANLYCWVNEALCRQASLCSGVSGSTTSRITKPPPH